MKLIINYIQDEDDKISLIKTLLSKENQNLDLNLLAKEIGAKLLDDQLIFLILIFYNNNANQILLSLVNANYKMLSMRAKWDESFKSILQNIKEQCKSDISMINELNEIKPYLDLIIKNNDFYSKFKSHKKQNKVQAYQIENIKI